MPKEKQERPRLITLLTVLLLLQTPVLLFLGLNLLTDRWSFLASWSAFWEELQAAVTLVFQTRGEFAREEVLLYDVIAFGILVISGVLAFASGVVFRRGSALTWIVSLIVQIGTLLSGIGLYWIHQPPQSYWLMLVGVVMVLYLNNGDVRQWFLQPKEEMVA